MILHVAFTDGSNPWVSLPADRQTIAKHWRRWMKHHPDTAQPVALCGGWHCRYNRAIGQYCVHNPRRYGVNTYRTLGHALRALDQLGGGTK